jgi:ubiquinone/menaquinone biosynthesis C-methylase UbiE
MDIISKEAQAHYEEGREHDRLLSPHGRLEFERSKSIVQRHIFKPPAKILDLGGGTGHYSFWLANQGYEVHLVDAMESHVETAKQVIQNYSLASISVGDARATRFGDEMFDIVIMFGPLYHLTEKRDRILALEEANRVLKPGGKLFAVCISKFASLHDGYMRGFIDDDMFQKIVDQDLKDGQHRNPDNHPEYFTTTKFHDPDEFRAELEQAGFLDISLHAVEGFAGVIPDLEARMSDETRRKRLFADLQAIELEPSIVGSSPHIMAVSRKWLEPRDLDAQKSPSSLDE